MRKFSLLGEIVGLAALAAPTGALARDGSNCDYAGSQLVSVPVVNDTATGNQVYVYGGSGVTGTALAAVGACANLPGNNIGGNEFEGGTVEAGASPTAGAVGVDSTAATPAVEVFGVPGVYGVVDGDNNNTGPLSNADQGYIGVSNYEPGGSADKDSSCDGVDSGGGSNSGGCVGIKSTPVNVPIPLIVCGNTSGNQFGEADGRDGCYVP
jgi:hypothetical protein